METISISDGEQFFSFREAKYASKLGQTGARLRGLLWLDIQAEVSKGSQHCEELLSISTPVDLK